MALHQTHQSNTPSSVFPPFSPSFKHSSSSNPNRPPSSSSNNSPSLSSATKTRRSIGGPSQHIPTPTKASSSSSSSSSSSHRHGLGTLTNRQYHEYGSRNLSSTTTTTSSSPKPSSSSSLESSTQSKGVVTPFHSQENGVLAEKNTLATGVNSLNTNNTNNTNNDNNKSSNTTPNSKWKTQPSLPSYPPGNYNVSSSSTTTNVKREEASPLCLNTTSTLQSTSQPYPTNTPSSFTTTNTTTITTNPEKNTSSRNPISSMTIAISPENAQTMLEASRAFNQWLNQLQAEEKEKQRKCQDTENNSNTSLSPGRVDMEMDTSNSVSGTVGTAGGGGSADVDDRMDTGSNPASPSHGVSNNGNNDCDTTTANPSTCNKSNSTKNSSSTSSSTSTTSTTSKPIYKLVLKAAVSCQNPLLSSYVNRLKSAYSKGLITMSEIEACLLLFLDMDKSSKLVTAFEVLGRDLSVSDVSGASAGASAGAGTEDQGTRASSPSASSVEDTIMEDTEAPKPKKGPEDSSSSTNDNHDNNNNDSTNSTISKSSNNNNTSSKSKDALPVPLLEKQGIFKLFKSFLTSISTCIHYQDKKDTSRSSYNNNNNSDTTNGRPSKVSKDSSCDSPSSSSSRKMELESQSPTHTTTTSTSLDHTSSSSSAVDPTSSSNASLTKQQKDWILSSQTEKEINDIAIYATDQVLQYVAKNAKSTTSGTNGTGSGNGNTDIDSGEKEEKSVTFQTFGEWYNSGGFSLVPWLELLDLAKWDYAGRAASSAMAFKGSKASSSSQQSLKQKQQASSDGRSNKKSTKARQQDKSINPSILDENLLGLMMMDPSQDQPLPPSSNTKSSSTSSRYKSPNDNLFRGSPRKDSPSSRILISFDFIGSKNNKIHITEENLRMLQSLVNRTSICKKSPDQVAQVILRYSTRRRISTSATPTSSTSSSSPNTRVEEVMNVLSRQEFGKCIRDLVPQECFRDFSESEMENFSNYFTNFFLSFAKVGQSVNGLDMDHVNAKELAVGFSMLCTGNKSGKLAAAFEIIEEKNAGFLSQRKLMRYLRSYLTMLAGISFLSSSSNATNSVRKKMLSSQDDGGAQYKTLFEAADIGARSTLNHFLQSQEKRKGKRSTKDNSMVAFEDFATWYTEGGYTIAPWLEFLDLKKFLSLLCESPQKSSAPINAPDSSGRIKSFDECFKPLSPHHDRSPALGRPLQSIPQTDILFTFPLAHRHSLVVLREDAAYVRTVVDQLELLSTTPEEIWAGLYSHARSNPPSPLSWQYQKIHKSGKGKKLDVDQSTFGAALEKILPKVSSRKRPASLSSPKETLNNFFQSFDLDQVDRVAANQLMGGLTLLCAGKKSSKLAFAFGLFDERNDGKGGKRKQSLCGKELFYFLRSFLIVTFSCCKQSLDLSADAVGRDISDTANMVTDDVMKYQWKTRRKERVDFDQFGEWYNEGGFETAPWLELLDLNKWVLLDEAKAKKMKEAAKRREKKDSGRQHLRDTSRPNSQSVSKGSDKKPSSATPKKPIVEPKIEPVDNDCPPPPPDDAIDPNTDIFFDDDIAMDGIDDIDFLFQDSGGGSEKENVDDFTMTDLGLSDAVDWNLNASGDFGLDDKEPQNDAEQTNSPAPPEFPPNIGADEGTKPLKFHLLTKSNERGYIVSISSRRVQLLKHLITESHLNNIDITAACEKIIVEADGKKLSKDKFDSAMRNVVALSSGISQMSTDTQTLLSDLLTEVFKSFDYSKSGEVDATELACGFTVLCGGRKSDKLEYAFELLDKRRSGLVSRTEMVRYLQSFLTVLLSICSCSIGREPAEKDVLTGQDGDSCQTIVPRVIGWGSSWATEEVFKSTSSKKKEIDGGIEHINFDSFAEWYTKGGYSSIPWLELLDLKKWVLA